MNEINPIKEMKSRITLFMLASLLATLMIPLSLSAQGDLLVTPRRVVFEGNKQSQELTLANTGQDTARYSVSFVQYRMTNSGTFELVEAPDSGQYFADKYLRFFPRAVTLAPNESQVVRMQFRKLPDMKPAEYRSHIYFRAVPKETALGDEAPVDSTTIGIRLTPIFGIAIPVIVRVGELDLSVKLSDVSIDAVSDTTTNLAVTINRYGDKSVYGDLTVNWVPEKGEPVEVGLVRGIAVYTPNKIRRFNMQLRKIAGVDYHKGKLLIKYQSLVDPKPELFAELEFLLK